MTRAVTARTRKLGTIVLGVALGLAVFAVILGTQAGEEATTAAPAGAPETTIEQIPEETSAVFVARRFVEALNDLDADRALSYLADDADIRGLVTSVGDHNVPGTFADFRLLLSLLEAQGYEQLPGATCQELGSSPDAVDLRCTFSFHSIRSDELGLAPFDGGSLLLTVRDDEIVAASESWDITKFSPQVWEPFAAWVRNRYPKDFAVMYTDAGQGARLSEESIRLWEKRSREYVRSRTATGEAVRIAERFMAARNAHDIRTAVSLVTDDGVTARLLWGKGLYPNMPAIRMNRRRAALALEAERLYGVRYTSVRCRRQPVWGAHGEAEVLCSYRMDSRLRQISGLPPERGSLGIGFRDGKVSYTSFPWLNVSFPSWVPVEGAAFARWVEVEHPEAGYAFHRGELFRTEGQELVLILRPKSLALLADYLDEYERAAAG
ncbi:MAG TPA: hypothetical protein VH650_02570 [Gaiellaceae bacterium]